MMNYYTESSGKKIIYANTFIPFSKEDKSFLIELHKKVRIRLIFVDNDSQEKNRIKTEVDNETATYVINAINWDNSLGTCTSKPISIGRLDSKQVYLNFASYDIVGTKIVHVVLYQDIITSTVHDAKGE
jgi:hypothetical protein